MLEPMDLPPIWNVPYRRNEFFTGREDILTHLYRSLQADTAAMLTQPQGMSGLGGIGKTQAALEYAYRYHADYQAVLWVRADSHSALVSGFVTTAHLLDLAEKDERDQNRVVQAVMRWLRSNTAWLLVFDNADDVTIVSEFLPTAHRGHILLTTRSRAMGQVAQPVEVEKMHPEVGAFFLLRRASLLPLQAHPDLASDDDRKLAKEISQLMDGLPLALDQAGAYMKEMSCSLSDYLDLYRKRAADLLKVRGSFDSNYPQSVATTWSLSFERVASANPASAELLHLCAFLYPDAIPEEIIVDGAADLGPILHPTAADPLQLDRALKEILRFSLLQRESDAQTLTIHRLVQEMLKDKMDANRQREWAERTVRAVNDAFPAVEFTMWPRCQRCILHAQRGAALIQQWNMEFPEATRLLNQTAYYLEERSQYEEAELHYLRLLAIRERVLESDHPDLAKTLNNLAALYHRQGKYRQAEPLLQRALAIRERMLGREYPEIAQSLNNLAVLYEKKGKFEQAEPLYQRALAIREQIVGPMHPATAMSLNNLALFYEKQAKYQQAEELYQRALIIREQMLGPTHPDTAMSLNNLAVLHRKQRKYEQAEAFYQRALAIYEQGQGPEHPDTINILNNLAALYYTQGKYEQAEQLYEHVLAVRERVSGPEHPSTAITLNNLALVYRERGRYDLAESFYLRSLAIREQVFGSEHPSTATCLNNLAQLYKDQGKYDKAEPLYQQALAIHERTYGPEHPDTAMSLNNLAELYRLQDKCGQAEPLSRRAIMVYKRVLGTEHPTTVQVMENYARLQEKMKRDQETAGLEAPEAAHD